MTPRRAGATRCRRGVAAVVAAVLVSCFHTHRVADEGGGGEESQGTGASKREQGSSATVTPKRIPPRGDRPAISASPEGLMNPGSARKIQQALKGRGYLEGVSGELDAETSAALRRFQQDRGLAATGAPDRETLRELGVNPSDVYQTGRAGASRGADPAPTGSAREEP